MLSLGIDQHARPTAQGFQRPAGAGMLFPEGDLRTGFRERG